MTTDTQNPAKRERPLSPHLQVYKPQITSMTSILHRASGVAMAFGLFLVTWGLVALAAGRDSFEIFIGFNTSVIGQILLLGWSAAFFYHLSTGIRHLIRDCGYLYENKDSCVSGWICIIAAACLTAAMWGYIYRDMIMGALA
jgi:succinate dehydrogenase / fumarate reductase cytochrome b subunit